MRLFGSRLVCNGEQQKKGEGTTAKRGYPPASPTFFGFLCVASGAVPWNTLSNHMRLEFSHLTTREKGREGNENEALPGVALDQVPPKTRVSD